MKKIWTMQEEAQRLRDRFPPEIDRAKFARDHKIPGGGAMVYQHIGARRPISLNAAKAYARAFECSLEDISPRWADKIAGTVTPIDSDIARPPIIEPAEWKALSKKTRELIESLVLSNLPDEKIDAIQVLITPTVLPVAWSNVIRYKRHSSKK